MRLTGNVTTSDSAELRARLAAAFGSGNPMDVEIQPDRTDLPIGLPAAFIYTVVVHMLFERGKGYAAVCYQERDGTELSITSSEFGSPRATVFLGEVATFPPVEGNLSLQE